MPPSSNPETAAANPNGWRVDIVENGRSGTVTYHEQRGTLRFPWEFGGDDVVAIVHVGNAREWSITYSWAAARRTVIVERVAAEVIRQKAPRCRYELDEERGDLLLRGGLRQALVSPDAAWMARYRKLRMMMGLVVLGAALVIAGLWWVKGKLFTIAPGKGTPIGLAVRIDTHIATLIRTLEPYVPTLHRDGSEDRYSIKLFLYPLDGSSEGRTITLAEHLGGNDFSLAKILGSDGRTIWFDVTGPAGVDLETFDLIGPDEFRKANPTLDAMWWEDGRGMAVGERLRSTARDRQSAMEFDPRTLKAIPVEVVRDAPYPFGPKPEDFLCAGVLATSTSWLGLHSSAEAEKEYKPKSWLKRVVRATDAKEQRQLYRGMIDPDSSGDHHHVIRMAPITDATYLNAAFLRVDDHSEPLRLRDPESVLMVHTSAPGLNGTLMVARVDLDGSVIWDQDSGIDRFMLKQILPGANSTALVGTRIPIPDKLSEPILVIIDHATGKAETVSLWR